MQSLSRWTGNVWVKLAMMLVLLILAVVVPRFLNNYYISLLQQVALYSMLGLGLNIVVGYAGLLDLGYAAFFAIGAYITAYYMTVHNVNYWVLIPLSALGAAISGIIIGTPTLRLRSDYLAIVTLGFGEITRITVTNLTFTGGPNGLYGVPEPTLPIVNITLTTPLQYYYLTLGLMIITVFFVSRLANSRIGRAWAYIREDELAAAAMGINPVRVKLLAYMLGAVWAGVAGSVLAVQQTAIDPTSFTYLQSVQILIIVVLGGLASVPGSILGAAVVVIVPELARSLPNIGSASPQQYRMLLFAIALILLMIFRPEGLWPSRRRRRELHTQDVEKVGPMEADASAAGEPVEAS